MEVTFATVELEKRYRSSAEGRKAWGEKTAKRYVQRVDALYEAEAAKDLYALKALQLHPLKGRRQGQHAMRLDDSWRLIVRFGDEELTIVRVEQVSKHYGD